MPAALRSALNRAHIVIARSLVWAPRVLFEIGSSRIGVVVCACAGRGSRSLELAPFGLVHFAVIGCDASRILLGVCTGCERARGRPNEK